MKKFLLVVLITLVCASPLCAEEVISDAGKEGTPKEVFRIFTEKWAMDNHYAPSGWMGDHGDIQVDDGYTKESHKGKSSIKISYSAKKSQGAGWMGVFWQNPPNNWGDQMGGYDLTGYKKLTFWAKGDKGGEVISEFKIGGINGMFADTDATAIGPVKLSNEWKQYEIDLEDLDLSYISGGFALTASSVDNPNGFVIYLDDLIYEK